MRNSTYCVMNAAFPPIVTQLQNHRVVGTFVALRFLKHCYAAVNQTTSDAYCWRQKRSVETSLRFIIARFANLGDLDGDFAMNFDVL